MSGKISIGQFLISLAVSLYGALVLVYLWGWFIAIPFNVPPLTFFHACGIVTMTAFIKICTMTKTIDSPTNFTELLFTKIFGYSACWLFGLIYSKLMYVTFSTS